MPFPRPAGRAELREGAEEVGPLLRSIGRRGPLAEIAFAGAPDRAHRDVDTDPAARAARYGEWLGGRYGARRVMPHVAASLFLKAYASRLVTPVVVGFAMERAVPDVSLANAFVAERGARPHGVRLRAMRVAAGDDAELMCHVQAWALRGHLEPVVEVLRRTMASRGCVLAPRMLWENVAAACVYTFSEVGAGPAHRERADSLMTDFLLGVPRYGARLLGELRAHDVDGRRQLLATRHTCCLKDRLPGASICLECPKLRDAAEREARIAARVRARDLMPELRLDG